MIAGSSRYLITTYEARSLAGNAVGAPTGRTVRVYLPPGYHEADGRYPVVYLLHGYGGDAVHAIVTTSAEFLGSYPAFARPLFPILLRDVLTLERLDRLIARGTLPPFILVQPDGGLALPQLHEPVWEDGSPRQKGSLYYDSDGTGRFGSAVFDDLVGFVDSAWRTRADRAHRFLTGGSMGGYGALLGGILHPHRFSRVAALSPSICGLDLVDLRLLVPFDRIAYGKTAAVEGGAKTVRDILHTCDLVFSRDRPLVPTIVRDERGVSVSMDEDARENWARGDAGRLAGEVQGAFEGVDGAFLRVALRVSCEVHDEFGLLEPNRRFDGDLDRLGIPHRFRAFSSFRARVLSPHSLGIAIELGRALRFLLTDSDRA